MYQPNSYRQPQLPAQQQMVELPANADVVLTHQFVNQPPYVDWRSNNVDEATGNFVNVTLVSVIQGSVEEQNNLYWFGFNYFSHNQFNNNEYTSLVLDIADYLLLYVHVNRTPSNQFEQTAIDLIVDAYYSRLGRLAFDCNFGSRYPHVAGQVQQLTVAADGISAWMRANSSVQATQPFGSVQHNQINTGSGYRGPQVQQPALQTGYGRTQATASMQAAYCGPTTHVERPGVAFLDTSSQQQPMAVGRVVQQHMPHERLVPTGIAAVTNELTRTAPVLAGVTSMLNSAQVNRSVKQYTFYEELDFTAYLPLCAAGENVIRRSIDGGGYLFAAATTKQLEETANMQLTYEMLETDITVAQRNGKVSTMDDLRASIAQEPLMLIPSEAKNVPSDAKCVSLSEPVYAHTLSEAIAIAEDVLLNVYNVVPDDARLVHFNVNLTTQYMRCSVEERTAITTLCAKQKLSTILDSLTTARSICDDRNFFAIDERLTSVVNTLINRCLGLGTKLESFTDDFPGLLQYLAEKHSYLDEKIIARFCTLLLTAVTLSLTMDKSDQANKPYDPVILLTPVSITLLPVNIGALQIAPDDTFRLLREDAHPELYEAMTGVLKRTNKVMGTLGEVPTVYTRLVCTLDNVWLEVGENAVSDGVMVRLYNPKPF